MDSETGSWLLRSIQACTGEYKGLKAVWSGLEGGEAILPVAPGLGLGNAPSCRSERLVAFRGCLCPFARPFYRARAGSANPSCERAACDLFAFRMSGRGNFLGACQKGQRTGRIASYTAKQAAGVTPDCGRSRRGLWRSAGADRAIRSRRPRLGWCKGGDRLAQRAGSRIRTPSRRTGARIWTGVEGGQLVGPCCAQGAPPSKRPASMIRSSDVSSFAGTCHSVGGWSHPPTAARTTAAIRPWSS